MDSFGKRTHLIFEVWIFWIHRLCWMIFLRLRKTSTPSQHSTAPAEALGNHSAPETSLPSVNLRDLRLQHHQLSAWSRQGGPGRAVDFQPPRRMASSCWTIVSYRKQQRLVLIIVSEQPSCWVIPLAISDTIGANRPSSGRPTPWICLKMVWIVQKLK